MRKLSVVLVLVVLMAFSLPSMAQNPFADVPAHHWAYDAVTQAVAGGIITGFPDGTYKGAQNLTRYEVAMIIARILDAIEQERRVLLSEMEKADAGLATSIEALEAMLEADMEALAESLNMEVTAVRRALLADMDVLEADLSTYVDALEARLKTQMGSVESRLGGRVDAVDSKVDAVEAKVDAVSADVAAVDAKVYAVDDRVVEVLEQLGEMDFWLDVLYDKVDYVDARVDDVAADVAAFDGKIADVSADVAVVDGKIVGLEADVSAVDAKVINVASDVGALRAKMSELEADLMYVAEDLDLYFDYLVDLEFWVDVLYDEMDYVAVRMEELSGKIDAVDSKVANVAADFNRQLSNLATAVDAIESDVAAVDSKVDDLALEVDRKLAALAAEVEASMVVDVSDEVAALEAMIRDATAKTAAVDAKVDAVAADVDSLAAQMDAGRAAMDARVDGVAGRVDALEADMSDATALLGELDFWIDFLFEEMDEVTSQIDGVAAELAADVAAVDARVTGVAAGLDAVDSKVDALAVKVDGVDAKVDALEARSADMALQLDEMEEDILARIAKTQRELSAAQATQVVAIVERMLERHEPDVTKVEVMEMIEGLNALIHEFNDELTEVLGDMDKELSALRFAPAQIVDLQKKTTDLEDRVAALEDPFLQFTAKTCVEFQAKDFQGVGHYYKDPFNTHDADGNLVAYDDTKQHFRHTVDLGMHLKREGVTADLNLQLVGNIFSLGDRDVFEMISLTGVIENEDFRADLKKGHGYTLTGYLFNDGDGEYDGMIVTVGDNKYGLFADDNTLLFGMSHGLDLFLPVTFYLGMEDTIDVAQITTDRNVLVGFKVEDIRLAIFDVTADYAFSRGELGDYHLNIVGKTSFLNDRIDFTADYLIRDDDFVAIEGTDGEAHRLNLTTTTTFHPVDLSLKNELNLLADINTHTFKAEVKEENAMRFAGFGNFGHFEVATSDSDNLAGQSRYFKSFRSFMAEDKLSFAAIYEYLVGEIANNTFVDNRDDDGEKNEFRLEADYDMTEKIDISATFRHNMLPSDAEQEFTLIGNWDFTEAIDFYARVFVPSYADNQLTLRGTYESAMLSGDFDAKAEKNVNRDSDSLILEANFKKASFYRLFGYDLNLGTGIMFRNDANDNYLNLYAGVDTEKELTERLSVTAASKLDKRDWVPNREGNDPLGFPLSGEGGLLITHRLGFTYQVFTDAAANLNYRYYDYRSNAAGDDEDYVGSVITGGFCVSF